MNKIKSAGHGKAIGGNYDIITIGGATEDITLHTGEGTLIDNKKDALKQNLLAFEYGAKIRVDKSSSYFGGGASNVAVSASLLGLKSSAIIAVGDDLRGEAVIRNLEKRGVDVSSIRMIKNKATGFSVLVMGEDHEHVSFTAREANSFLEISGADSRKLKNTKWIYISSLSGKWKDVLKKVIDDYAGKARIAWNPGHIQLAGGIKAIGRYFKKISVAIVNKDEAIELVVSDKKYRNKKMDFLSDTDNLLKIIKGYGPVVAVITDGGSGAHAFDGKNFYHQPVARKAKEIDTNGAGDAFSSSFIAGLEIYQNDIKKAMRLAAVNSVSVIEKEGAQNGLLPIKEIKKLM